VSSFVEAKKLLRVMCPPCTLKKIFLFFAYKVKTKNRVVLGMKAKFETQIPIITMVLVLSTFKNLVKFLNNYDSFENETMHKTCFFNWS
jgi:hypothetical protein